MRNVLIGLAAVVVIGLVVFTLLAWRPAIAEVDPVDPSSFSADLVARGEVIAAAGYCATCHTVAGKPAYAGGYGVASDFGTIYSTNITPDPEQGIGRWSEEAFVRAMRKGVRRDGAHLFPAFPYTHFAKVSDEDLSALYAFLMTQPAAQTEIPENTLGAPFNWRALQGGWKLLFFRGGEFKPDSSKSDAWNRGAYLSEGLSHCSACHSPRNGLGAEEGGSERYAGALVDDWYAPAISTRPDASLPWTEEELFAFLRTGGSPFHGTATGTMSQVVHDGLGLLPDEDVRAIATYFADLAGAPAEIPLAEIEAKETNNAGDQLAESQRRGELIYVGYCVSCHDSPPTAQTATRPELAINSAVVGPDPTNFARIVLRGVSDAEGRPDTYMPGFGMILSDRDVADVAAYLRTAYAGGDASGLWADVETRVAEMRALRDPMR
jgi:mono/diheme cytochrome c family protein